MLYIYFSIVVAIGLTMWAFSDPLLNMSLNPPFKVIAAWSVTFVILVFLWPVAIVWYLFKLSSA